MYQQAIAVKNEVNSIDTKFTALLSRTLAPEILLTVGPGFPTTCRRE